MYRYDEYDQHIVDERAAQFRDQTRRYLAGELTEDEFRPLRLQNGLYVQRHAPMLRIGTPYAVLTSRQLHKLADLARRYDHSYVHFTTRHTVQFNWPQIKDTPDMLAELATVQLHGIQSSGNCIRNITTDPFAGVAPDEIVDPRPLAEILRQWSALHPEFAALPRKFKIALSGAKTDRAVIRVHDIGLEVIKNEAGEIAVNVWVGGGLGRTPVIGSLLKEWLPWEHLITYCESILRVYNRNGRRDNSFKARIKILVKALGIEEFRRQVEEEWSFWKDGPGTLTQAEFDRVAASFAPPAYEKLADEDAGFDAAVATNPAFAIWVRRCVHSHKRPGYRAVTLSLKKTGVPPGDITADQMDVVADLADQYSLGELRASHEQNLILADVKLSELFALWQKANAAALATPNTGLITDIICCPGGDLCSLAKARSVPVAHAVQKRFDDIDYQLDLGEIDLNISGCMNSCSHHHVAHLGILGVEKEGAEWYQISLGGAQGNEAAIGTVIGRAVPAPEVPDVVEQIIRVFVEHREGDERFIDVVHRIGLDPFRARVYGSVGAANEEVKNV